MNCILSVGGVSDCLKDVVDVLRPYLCPVFIPFCVRESALCQYWTLHEMLRAQGIKRHPCSFLGPTARWSTKNSATHRPNNAVNHRVQETHRPNNMAPKSEFDVVGLCRPSPFVNTLVQTSTAPCRSTVRLGDLLLSRINNAFASTRRGPVLDSGSSDAILVRATQPETNSEIGLNGSISGVLESKHMSITESAKKCKAWLPGSKIGRAHV